MGNIGSGFGNPNVRCGFEDGYFPAHAPLGFQIVQIIKELNHKELLIYKDVGMELILLMNGKNIMLKTQVTH